MSRIRYEQYPEACRVVEKIVARLGLDYIDTNRVFCVKSWGARTNAIARIYGLPKPWIVAGMKPGYVIELISEKFDSLSCKEKIKTLIHELLHIPSGFSGGLRPHGKLVNSSRVNSLYRSVRGIEEELCQLLSG
jgi:predicted metallopeptidase